MLCDSEHAWLSGFFDGEGCLHLDRRGTAQFQVTTTSEATRDHVIELLGRAGIIAGVTAQKRQSAAHAPCWKIYARRIATIRQLTDLLEPAAVTKRSQWALLRQWLDAPGRGSGRLRTKHERARDDAFYWDMKRLNARGPA